MKMKRKSKATKSTSRKPTKWAEIRFTQAIEENGQVSSPAKKKKVTGNIISSAKLKKLTESLTELNKALKKLTGNVASPAKKKKVTGSIASPAKLKKLTESLTELTKALKNVTGNVTSPVKKKKKKNVTGNVTSPVKKNSKCRHDHSKVYKYYLKLLRDGYEPPYQGRAKKGVQSAYKKTAKHFGYTQRNVSSILKKFSHNNPSSSKQRKYETLKIANMIANALSIAKNIH
jgi:hypothetical protein